MVNGITLIMKAQVFHRRNIAMGACMSNKQKHQNVETQEYQDHVISVPLSLAFLYREEK